MKKKTVLVVDDEKDLGYLLNELLSKHGYECVYCENGAQAWSWLNAHGPADLAVVDVNMPEMDGVELTHLIRSEARFRRMTILMLTVRDSVEDQVEGYQTGADDYLPKPFEPKVLLGRLHALERRAAHAV